MYCQMCAKFNLIGEVVGECTEKDKIVCTYDKCSKFTSTKNTVYEVEICENKYKFTTEDELVELLNKHCRIESDEFTKFTTDGGIYQITNIYAEYKYHRTIAAKIKGVFETKTIKVYSAYKTLVLQ